MNKITDIHDNLERILKKEYRLLTIYGGLILFVFVMEFSVYFLMDKLNIIGALLSIPIFLVTPIIFLVIPIFFIYLCFLFLSNRPKIVSFKKELDTIESTIVNSEENILKQKALSKIKFALDFNIRSIYVIIIITMICILINVHVMNK